MSGINKEVEKMINTSDNSYWTRFELDLISCIRDKYPIIYSNSSGLVRHQRATKIRNAWKQISHEFVDVTPAQIKNKWRIIIDNYLKVKIYGGEAGNEEHGNKYLDGTLKFLEGVDQELLMRSNKTPVNSNNEDSFEDDKKESYALTTRDLLHEEVDLDDEPNMYIKQEVQEDKNEQAPKWTEDELMNATRLTKEMVDELIVIKTRNYFTAPANSTNK